MFIIYFLYYLTATNCIQQIFEAYKTVATPMWPLLGSSGYPTNL